MKVTEIEIDRVLDIVELMKSRGEIEREVVERQWGFSRSTVYRLFRIARHYNLIKTVRASSGAMTARYIHTNESPQPMYENMVFKRNTSKKPKQEVEVEQKFSIQQKLKPIPHKVKGRVIPERHPTRVKYVSPKVYPSGSTL